ncbi:hypothetical protein DFH28DRAFT_881201 [Melampsora americana]|nr:hypothetical protein DFH28DRAFT_881201 [Melampsora americana]
MPSRPFVPPILHSIPHEAISLQNVDQAVSKGTDKYPLLQDIYDIVPLPFIHYVPLPDGSDLPSDSLRLVRNVTKDPPAFDEPILRRTLPDVANIREDFVAGMRTTIAWVVDAKRKNGRMRMSSDEVNALQAASTKKRSGPKRIHEDTWTFRCPCAGHPRKKPSAIASNNNPAEKLKRNSKTSIKVGCPAKFTIKKRIDNGLYELDWTWKHANHDPYSLSDMKQMRLATPVRDWLCERVISGMDWAGIRRLLKSPDLFPEDLENPDYVPELLNIDYQTVKNMIRKRQHDLVHLDTNAYLSLQAWGKKLREEGWHVRDCFDKDARFISFGFFSPWQKEQLRSHGGDIVCLDSTHNTTNNFPKDFGNLKLSLYTIVIRSPVTGKGVPVVWFLTSNEQSCVFSPSSKLWSPHD